MANTDGAFLESFTETENSTPIMVAGRVETIIQLDIKVVFEDSFKGKDGKDITFYAAMIPVQHGLKQISITKELFEKATKPGKYTVKMIVDVNYGKNKFDIA